MSAPGGGGSEELKGGEDGYGDLLKIFPGCDDKEAR
jgi:hypothetical protein